MGLRYKLQQYLRYKLRARNEYSLHSPYMFDLYNAVFKTAPKPENTYDSIVSLKRNMLTNATEIAVTDLGAGSKVHASSNRSISSITKSTSKPEKYAQFIALLASYHKTKTIIELGTCLGVTTAYLAKKNQESTVFTIEGCPNIRKLATLNFSQLGLTNIISLEGNFDQVFPKLLSDTGKFDFLFIDGNHTREATLRYFEMAKHYAHHGSVIVFDDIYWSKDMTLAWKEIIADPDVTVTIDMFELGIVFFNKDLSKQDFVLRY